MMITDWDTNCGEVEEGGGFGGIRVWENGKLAAWSASDAISLTWLLNGDYMEMMIFGAGGKW